MMKRNNKMLLLVLAILHYEVTSASVIQPKIEWDYSNWQPILAPCDTCREARLVEIDNTNVEPNQEEYISSGSNRNPKASIVPAELIPISQLKPTAPSPRKNNFFNQQPKQNFEGIQLVYLPEGSLTSLSEANFAKILTPEPKFLINQRLPNQNEVIQDFSIKQKRSHLGQIVHGSQQRGRNFTPLNSLPMALVASQGQEADAREKLNLLEAALTKPELPEDQGDLPKVFIAPSHIPPPPGYVKIPLIPQVEANQQQEPLPHTFLTSDVGEHDLPGFVRLQLPNEVAQLSRDIPVVHNINPDSSLSSNFLPQNPNDNIFTSTTPDLPTTTPISINFQPNAGSIREPKRFENRPPSVQITHRGEPKQTTPLFLPQPIIQTPQNQNNLFPSPPRPVTFPPNVVENPSNFVSQSFNRPNNNLAPVQNQNFNEQFNQNNFAPVQEQNFNEQFNQNNFDPVQNLNFNEQFNQNSFAPVQRPNFNEQFNENNLITPSLVTESNEFIRNEPNFSTSNIPSLPILTTTFRPTISGTIENSGNHRFSSNQNTNVNKPNFNSGFSHFELPKPIKPFNTKESNSFARNQFTTEKPREIKPVTFFRPQTFPSQSGPVILANNQNSFNPTTLRPQPIETNSINSFNFEPTSSPAVSFTSRNTFFTSPKVAFTTPTPKPTRISPIGRVISKKVTERPIISSSVSTRAKLNIPGAVTPRPISSSTFPERTTLPVTQFATATTNVITDSKNKLNKIPKKKELFETNKNFDSNDLKSFNNFRTPTPKEIVPILISNSEPRITTPIPFTTTEPTHFKNSLSTHESDVSPTSESPLKVTTFKPKFSFNGRKRKPLQKHLKTTTPVTEPTSDKASTLFPPFSVARTLTSQRKSRLNESNPSRQSNFPTPTRGGAIFGRRLRPRTRSSKRNQATSSSNIEIEKKSPEAETSELVQTPSPFRSQRPLPDWLQQRRRPRVRSRLVNTPTKPSRFSNFDIEDPPLDIIDTNEVSGAESALVVVSEVPANNILSDFDQEKAPTKDMNSKVPIEENTEVPFENLESTFEASRLTDDHEESKSTITTTPLNEYVFNITLNNFNDIKNAEMEPKIIYERPRHPFDVLMPTSTKPSINTTKPAISLTTEPEIIYERPRHPFDVLMPTSTNPPVNITQSVMNITTEIYIEETQDKRLINDDYEYDDSVNHDYETKLIHETKEMTEKNQMQIGINNETIISDLNKTNNLLNDTVMNNSVSNSSKQMFAENSSHEKLDLNYDDKINIPELETELPLNHNVNDNLHDIFYDMHVDVDEHTELVTEHVDLESNYDYDTYTTDSSLDKSVTLPFAYNDTSEYLNFSEEYPYEFSNEHLEFINHTVNIPYSINEEDLIEYYDEYLDEEYPEEDSAFGGTNTHVVFALPFEPTSSENPTNVQFSYNNTIAVNASIQMPLNKTNLEKDKNGNDKDSEFDESFVTINSIDDTIYDTTTDYNSDDLYTTMSVDEEELETTTEPIKSKQAKSLAELFFGASDNSRKVLGHSTVTEVRASDPIICFSEGRCIVGHGIR